MKKVLVITLSYPITGGTRIERFVKYLGDFGYQPVVLTTKRNRQNSAGKKLNTSVGSIRVYRAFSVRRTPFRILSRYFKLEEAKDFFERLFFIPDLAITWVPDAIIKGLRILKNENIDLILSTSPPESAHIIGMLLSKFTHKKWVADFRDLWTQKGVTYRPPTILHHKIAMKLEEYFLLRADHVIAVTEEIRKMYLNSFQIDREKTSVITNAYNHDDLESITAQTHLDRDRLNIGYMGTFEKRGFPWKQFLIALRQLINFKPGAKVQVNIYGEVPSDNVMYFITENHLTNYIKFHGEFSHSDAMRLTAENDLLLLLLYETDYSAGTATLKLYNYLIMGKPIFAIIPESGAAARIIRGTNTGKIVSPKNNEGIFKKLLEYYEMWTEKKALQIFPDAEEIKKYDGKILTKNLARVFNSVSEGGERIEF